MAYIGEFLSGCFGVLIGTIVTVCLSEFNRRPRVSLKIHMPGGVSGGGKVILEVKNIGTRIIKSCEISGHIYCNLNKEEAFFNQHKNQTLRIKHRIAPGESLSFLCDIVPGQITTHHDFKRLITLDLLYDDDFIWNRSNKESHNFIVDYYMNDYKKNAIVYDLHKLK